MSCMNLHTNEDRLFSDMRQNIDALMEICQRIYEVGFGLQNRKVSLTRFPDHFPFHYVNDF